MSPAALVFTIYPDSTTCQTALAPATVPQLRSIAGASTGPVTLADGITAWLTCTEDDPNPLARFVVHAFTNHTMTITGTMTLTGALTTDSIAGVTTAQAVLIMDLIDAYHRRRTAAQLTAAW